MKLLSICIPTYNRFDIVKEDIELYLSLSDKRFCIKVVDNCSIDSTYEFLNSIKDDRLIIKRNPTNIGSIQNMFAALTNNDSKYSLLVLDKDLLDVNILSLFLDELEKSNEAFGFIDPDMRLDNPFGKPYKESFSCGYDSIYKMAYLNLHPSGYLYNSQLINKVYKSNVFLSLDKDFVFPFEVINAGLALEHDSFIFHWPIIIRARERQNDPSSITYNQSNLWFFAPQRLKIYTTYLRSAYNLSINQDQMKTLANHLTSNVLNDTTLLLRNLMKNDYACSHYKISKADVSFIEMHRNIINVLKTYRRVSQANFTTLYVFFNSIKLYLYQNISIIKYYIKSCLKN